jgi:creatinine amidohydrolase
MTASGWWRDLTSPELAGLDPELTVALLPVAAIEQHGPHLPLGTDALINAGIVAAALALGMPDGLFDVAERIHGLHGGEIETSLMLHLRPDLVRTDRLPDHPGPGPDLAARNRLLGLERPVGIGWLARDLGADGVCGAAARADARRGERLLGHLADRLVDLVRELAATPLVLLADRPPAAGDRS